VTVRTATRSSDALIVGGSALAIAAGAFATTVGASRLAVLALPAAALLPYAMLAIGDLRRVLVAAVVADVFLQWDINLGYQAAAGALGAEAGLNISLTTFALAGLYALWWAERTRPYNDAPAPRLEPARPLFAYVGISAVSIAAARDPALGVYYLALLVQTLLLFMYVVSTVRSRGDMLFIATALMVAMAAEGGLMLVLAITGAGFDMAGLNTSYPLPGGATGAPYSRVSGTTGPPNAVASLFILLLPLALALVAGPVPRFTRAAAGVALLVTVPALILTGSRGGWVGFLVGCAVLAAAAVSRGLITAKRVLGAGAVIITLAIPLSGMIGARITDPAPGSASSRVSMARLAADMIADRPLLGVGLNNVGVNIVDYAGPQFTRQFVFTIHDKYLLVASESGLGALAAFLWFLVATVAAGVRRMRSSDPLISLVATGLVGGLIGHMIQMTVDIFASRAQVQSLWLVAALIAVLGPLDAEPVSDGATR
jgi:putative inorganic carbon (hco3(-)) transporter